MSKIGELFNDTSGSAAPGTLVRDDACDCEVAHWQFSDNWSANPAHKYAILFGGTKGLSRHWYYAYTLGGTAPPAEEVERIAETVMDLLRTQGEAR